MSSMRSFWCWRKGATNGSTQLRTQWPDLARLCVDGVDLLKADLSQAEAAVVQHALINRLDLMNVHAQLVDAWRQIAVFANALLGTFNVQYHLDSSTPAGAAQPFNFSAARTNQQLILNTELPLVRLPERNNYRACLINYQRSRRILQRAEDEVAYDTRNELRLLRQQEENYRIQDTPSGAGVPYRGELAGYVPSTPCTSAGGPNAARYRDPRRRSDEPVNQCPDIAYTVPSSQ